MLNSHQNIQTLEASESPHLWFIWVMWRQGVIQFFRKLECRFNQWKEKLSFGSMWGHKEPMIQGKPDYLLLGLAESLLWYFVYFFFLCGFIFHCLIFYWVPRKVFETFKWLMIQIKPDSLLLGPKKPFFISCFIFLHACKCSSVSFAFLFCF